jgi:hypothetical protein
MSKPLTIAYSDIYLDWKLGAGDGSHPTNPVRAKLAIDEAIQVINQYQPDLVLLAAGAFWHSKTGGLSKSFIIMVY